MIKFRTKYSHEDEKVLMREINIIRIEKPEFFNKIEKLCIENNESFVTVYDEYGKQIDKIHLSEDIYIEHFERKIMYRTLDDGSYDLCYYADVKIGSKKIDDELEQLDDDFIFSF